MKFVNLIREYQSDPANLETLYQQAARQNNAAEFTSDLQAVHSETPDNILFQAWFYRLQAVAEVGRKIYWKLALPLAALCGLILWIASDDSYQFIDRIPLFILLAPPVIGTGMLAYLALASQKGYLKALWLSAGLLVATVYILLAVPTMPEKAQYQAVDLMALHLPALALAAVGAFTTGVRSDARQRFAFVIKSLEVVTTGGLFAIALGIFGMVTLGLFDALRITIPEIFLRLITAGVGGMVPVIAVAIIYNPLATPADQDFSQGLSKFLGSLLRLMIVPTLVVAVVYTAFIPFNFMEPFNNRNVLIIYNAMLFAVMGLLVGVTPVHQEELSPALQKWLRGAIMAVAGLAVLVSLYALAAIVYRTWADTLTMNRMVVIGWNIVNIAVLSFLLFGQVRVGQGQWALEIKRAFYLATMGYTAWACLVVVLVPLLFR